MAKATLYQQFRSKDELVAACLRERADEWLRTVAAPAVTRSGSSARRVGGLFETLARQFASPEYRGCAFINAAAEYPGQSGRVADEIGSHRAQVRHLFVQLLKNVPPRHRAERADQLVLLYDGAMVGAQLGGGPQAAIRARKVAQRLLEAVP